MTLRVPATVRALDAWRIDAVLVHTGGGPGKHPFVPRAIAPASPYCGRCGREACDLIHRAPKRRRVAAFGTFATLFPPRGPDFTGA